MYSRFKIALKYLNYYFTSSNGRGHGTHSPFVFHFIKHVLNDKIQYPQYDSVEELRQKLLTDKTVLTIEDFGAGSTTKKTNQRSISSIAEYAAKPKKYSQLLFRIVKEYKPKTITELGTSLGITTSYFSRANKDAKIITIEGSPEIAAIAKQNFQSAGSQNIELSVGHFDKILLPTIDPLVSVDLAFIDGNHRRIPTEKYFLQLLTKKNNDSIFIFDDIHWSSEMERAWQTIKSHEAVRCSIDLFFIGIIFFREEFKEKQHFKIRF